MLAYILSSIALISLISLVGIFFFAQKIEKHLFYLVSFAVGALLGVTFLDLLQETQQFSVVLLGILVFFILEKILYWHHHHHYEEKHKKHCAPYAYLNLFGDGLHNFLDGMIIASSYLTSIPLGMSVTFAIALHELPQEIGDYGILLASGLDRKTALGYNFLSAASAFLGGLLVYAFSLQLEGIDEIFIAFAAGGFLYIATADLLPELHKERAFKKSLQQILCILLGIGAIWILA